MEAILAEETRPISIIVPALNEADCLLTTLETIRLRSRIQGHEIILVDSGSSDETASLGRIAGARVLAGAFIGRARPMNYGAAHARHDTLLFLDSDTLVPPDFDLLIARALKQPIVAGGAFEFALDGKGLSLRFIELINRIRYRIWRRYFGDQGIFVRKSIFKQVGGFPDRLLMEASDFTVRMQKLGKIKLIRKKMITSARRFQSGGPLRVLLKDAWIWLLDLLHFPVDRYGKQYWAWNQSGSSDSLRIYNRFTDRKAKS